MDSIKATFIDITSTLNVINRYSKIPDLIIDDFGLEKQTEWRSKP